MKKIYMFLTAVFAMLFVGTTEADADPIRVNLNVDNMEWVLWNGNADKTMAWGRKIKTIDGPEITITHTNNNMAFWNGTDLQFYALVGSSHPQNYVIAVEEGYKILEVGCDFIVGTHPSVRPSTAEYGVSLSINGEEAVVSTVSKADYETGTGTPSHAEAKDISEDGNVTEVSLSVDFVADEALNGQNNALFVNAIGLYVIIEPLEGMQKAIIDLQAAFNKYNVVDQFVEGTDPGCYPLSLITALETALVRADYDELEFTGELDGMTEDDIRARITDLENAYNALVAAKIPITLPDGYYRIRTRTMYTNTINTGEVDGNNQPITRDESMYKYIRNVIGEDQITSRWQNRTDKADDEALMLFQLTNKDGFVDLMNVATETRFNDISASGTIVSSQEADGLLYIDAYETADNETSVFIRMAEKKDENNSLHQSGHGGGTGVSGTLVGWYAVVSNEAQPASLWVFEPVSDADAQAIMEAYIPVKERNEMLVEYHKIYDDAASKIEVAKDPIIGENGLITSADQLSSPWTESSEGSLEALIDGNPSSYWHSAWSSGNVANHTHYLQVALPDGDYSELTLQITRRPVQNDHVTLWGVYGSNDPEAADEAWEVVASLPTPFGSNTETINTKGFETKGFKYLRFYIDGTTTGRGYGHASEFQLFPISQNPNSQYAKLGEIATTLDAIVKAQADKEEDDITKEDYETLKDAYEAFIGQIVDPTELRQLLAQLEGKTSMIVIGTQPGFWKDNSTAAAFNDAYDAAKAYNEAGVYTRTESDQHVATLTRLSNTITDAAIGIEEGKWYRFRFGTEDEYDQYGWEKGPASESVLEATQDVLHEALFGKYVTIGNIASETIEYKEDVLDGDGQPTGEQNDRTATQYTIEEAVLSEVSVGQSLVIDATSDIPNPDFALFRFVAANDSAYMIQNKATGLFIKTGTTGHAILSVHPSLFKVSAMGYGANAIKAFSIANADNNYLHIQAGDNALVTWNANTPGSNSTLYIEEAEAVASDYDGSSFNISMKPGSVNTFCYPVEISAAEGMYGINRIEGNELVLAPLTKAVAGRPFIYINGETENYDAELDDDYEPVPFKHGYEINPEPYTSSYLKGTYNQITLERGDVVAEGNQFVIIKDVMHGGIVAANQAYISKENNFTISEAVTLNITTEEDGIAAAIADVAKNGVIYTIDGRVVSRNGNLNTISRLPKGIYLLNGRKVTVK